MWFNAYLNGCCVGNWGVLTSTDGISFTAVSLNVSGTYALVDGNALFVDNDGTAYNIYTSEAQDHHVSIDALTETYTDIKPGANTGLFPDRYVEGAILFKRNDSY